MTLHGSQLKGATVIVASPPCQAYSYRSMPWKRARALPPPDNTLFERCFAISKQAEVPIVVENVRGAEEWVGRAKWHYGSYYLWGDVPALMPIGGAFKTKGADWTVGSGKARQFNDLRNIPRFERWNDTWTRDRNKAAKAAFAAKAAQIPLPLAQHIARVFKP
jgi:hypothetical protein